jgi:hypothetical protein
VARPPLRSLEYLSHSFTTVSTSDLITFPSREFLRTAAKQSKKSNGGLLDGGNVDNDVVSYREIEEQQ